MNLLDFALNTKRKRALIVNVIDLVSTIKYVHPCFRRVYLRLLQCRHLHQLLYLPGRCYPLETVKLEVLIRFALMRIRLLFLEKSNHLRD